MVDRQHGGATARSTPLVLYGILALVLALIVAVRCRSARAGSTSASTLGSPTPEGPASPASAPDDPRSGIWQATVDELVARATQLATRLSKGAAEPGSITVAVHVKELESGVELAAREPDRAMRPASNLKLVTSAAALVLLGPAAQWTTAFEAAGTIEGGVLRGDLIVRAGGDPLIDPAGKGRCEARFAEAASKLARCGLQRIAGDLVLDEGTYLQPAPGPGWPAANQHWDDYCARSGGFSANGGVIVAEVTPAVAGEKALVEVHPSPFGPPPQLGVTTSRGGSVDVQVGATAARVLVSGSLPEGSSPYLADFAHPDPIVHFGALLEQALHDQGIELAGSLRRERCCVRGEALLELCSSVAEALPLINAESANGVADQLFFMLGDRVAGAGTREGGGEAVARALARLGLSPVGLVQVDGSGLSRENRVTARQITSLLAGVLGGDGDLADLYLGSMAVAGVRGTLEDRLKGTLAAGRVRAKTGWIAGVSALSGVADAVNGRRYVFSILVQYPSSIGGLNSKVFKPLQDDLVRLLVEEGP